MARRAGRPAAARGLKRINVTVRAVWARRPDGPGDGNGAAGGPKPPAPSVRGLPRNGPAREQALENVKTQRIYSTVQSISGPGDSAGD